MCTVLSLEAAQGWLSGPLPRRPWEAWACSPLPGGHSMEGRRRLGLTQSSLTARLHWGADLRGAKRWPQEAGWGDFLLSRPRGAGAGRHSLHMASPGKGCPGPPCQPCSLDGSPGTPSRGGFVLLGRKIPDQLWPLGRKWLGLFLARRGAREFCSEGPSAWLWGPAGLGAGGWWDWVPCVQPTPLQPWAPATPFQGGLRVWWPLRPPGLGVLGRLQARRARLWDVLPLGLLGTGLAHPGPPACPPRSQLRF